MEVKIARSAGFCWGVKRAVDVALSARQQADGGEVLTHGPLIHNKLVVEMLQQRGIGQFDPDRTVPANQTVVMRAHGLPPRTVETLQQKGFRLVDATCPHVVRTQKRIQQLSKRGYNVIIVGEPNHAEVVALVGYAATKVVVVSSVEEAQAVFMEEPIVVVQQSTFSQYDAARIHEVLKSRFQKIEFHNTLCGVTTKAQSEVTELVEEVDAIVVVGDRMSANTRKLAKVAKERNIPTYFVESAEELAPQEGELKKFRVVGVTAGTSTPDWQYQEVVDRLRAL